MRPVPAWLAGLALGAALAAPPPACARAGPLKVATWNLDWLTLRPAGDAALPPDVAPRGDADFDLLRGYAATLKADVVALQEVDGADAARKVFPAAEYDLVMADDAVVQRVGFAIRRGVAWRRNPDLTGLDVADARQRHLRSGVDVTVGDGALRLLAVHLKTGCWARPLADGRRDCRLLRRQVGPLLGWVAARRAAGTPYVVLGDFNRRMDGDDELGGDLAAAGARRLTAGMASPCWGGEAFIDHIFAGGAAAAWFRPGSLAVLPFAGMPPDRKDRLSDHCPVSARFELPR